MKRNLERIRQHWMLRRATMPFLPEIILSECQKEIEKIWARKRHIWIRNKKLENLRKKLKVP